MATFIIHTHGRLQEWVAEEKGYFAAEGLTDYALSSHGLLSRNQVSAPTTAGVPDKRYGAYQTYEQGREASVSCACHWTVNKAASAEFGRLWGECYTVTPCGVFVPARFKHQCARGSRGCRGACRLPVRQPLHDDPGTGTVPSSRTDQAAIWRVSGGSGRSVAGWQRTGRHRVRSSVLRHRAAWLPEDRRCQLHDRGDGAARGRHRRCAQVLRGIAAGADRHRYRTSTLHEVLRE